MSELNNYQKYENKKKMPFIIKVLLYILIFVLIFAVMIFGKLKFDFDISKFIPNQVNEKIYSILGINIEEKNDVTDEKINYTEEPDISNNPSNIKKLGYYDKYCFNNIEIKSTEETKGDIVYEYEFGGSIYKLKYQYITISGLKNVTVEEKINKKLKHAVDDLVKQIDINDSSLNYAQITTSVRGNYANIISVEISKMICNVEKDNNKNPYEYETKTLNIRLDTGEEIDFEDLFTPDTDVKKIVGKALYDGLIRKYVSDRYSEIIRDFDGSYTIDEEIDPTNFENYDYGRIENELSKLINKFLNDNNKTFSFTEVSINIEIDDIYVGIKLLENYDNMNIFNIVNEPNSLYKNGENEKENYIFRTSYMTSMEVLENISKNQNISVFNNHISPITYQIGMEEDEETEEEKEYSRQLSKNIKDIKDLIKQDNISTRKGYLYSIREWYDSEYVIDDGLQRFAFFGTKVEFAYDDFDKELDAIYADICENCSNNVEYYFDTRSLIQDKKYKIYDIVFIDKDLDGTLEMGQRLIGDENGYVEYPDGEYKYIF